MGVRLLTRRAPVQPALVTRRGGCVGMAAYLFERVARSLLVLLGVVLVAYALVLADRRPAGAMVGPDAPPSEVARVRRELWVRSAAADPTGPLRRASCSRAISAAPRRTGRPAFPLIVERLPATLALAAAAMLDQPGDRAAARDHLGGAAWAAPSTCFGTVLVFAGQSMPVFWMGIMLILLFSLTLQAAAGLRVRLAERDHAGLRARRPRRGVPDPPAALGDAGRAQARTTCGRPAPRGCSSSAVIVRHGLRNALIPVITASGVQFAVLMGGAVIVEQVFAWPGVGSLAVSAINNRDVALVVGVDVRLRRVHPARQPAGRSLLRAGRPARAAGLTDRQDVRRPSVRTHSERRRRRPPVGRRRRVRQYRAP